MDAPKRGRGRPRKSDDEKKQKVTFRLDPDVYQGLEASGPKWQSTGINDLLRAALGIPKSEAP